MNKFTKGKFELHLKQGVKMEGNLSPYLRFCIGTAILLIAASPFLCALAYLLQQI
ncbi:hypothetical protein [Acinetobacter qingfengensis]|uniref:hypothetical protein n=1 Tax=Acinetobacter qingfengensis TaxID=1262585 RepID=UPI0014882CDD|nr:hypothetical protein [Acinetobacter qingfengensis]